MGAGARAERMETKEKRKDKILYMGRRVAYGFVVKMHGQDRTLFQC